MADKKRTRAAYCRADRERQVGAGAEARRASARRYHQCGFDAGLSRSADHHGAADAGRGGARAASPLRSRRCGGELFGRPLVRRCRRGAEASLGRGQGADPHRRHRPLLQGADARALRGAADAAGDPCRGACADRGAGRAGDARRARPPRPRCGGAAAARRQDAGRPRAGGAGSDRTLARRLAPRRHAGGSRSEAHYRRVPERSGPSSIAGSMPGSMPCWPAARWTR